LGSFATPTIADAHSAVSANHHQIETHWGASGDHSKVTRTVMIVGHEISFNVTRLTVKKGDTVRLLFVNKGG